MSWTRRIRTLPLRRKVLVTVAGAAAILLGITTYLSFGYWHAESIAAAEAQALLAASSVHVPVEQALRAGRTEDARRVLRRRLMRGVGALLLRLISETTITGRESLPKQGPLLRRTGTTPRCASRWGDVEVFDMVGNLDEWVDDPEGTFVGGIYARAKKDGCASTVRSHGFDYSDYSTGFRCCAAPELVPEDG